MFLLTIVPSRRIWGLVLGVAQLIGAAVLLTIHEDSRSTSSLDVALDVWKGLAPCVIVIVAVTVTIVEGIPMFTREWGKKHREAGREEVIDALEQVGLTPEQKTKLDKALAARRAEKEKEPA